MLRGVVIIVCAVAIGLAGFWLLLPREPSYGMFQEGAAADVARVGLSFFATLGGVVLGSAYRQLKKLQAAGQEVIDNAGALVSRMSRSLDLWLALASAPIVYALLLKTTAGMNLSGLIVVALQNGFCCLLIIDQLNPAPARSAPPAENAKGAGG